MNKFRFFLFAMHRMKVISSGGKGQLQMIITEIERHERLESNFFVKPIMSQLPFPFVVLCRRSHPNGRDAISFIVHLFDSK